MTENRIDVVEYKLNVKNIILFIVLFIALTASAILLGFIPCDPVGILVGLFFVGSLIFIGFLIDYLNLGKYFGG